MRGLRGNSGQCRTCAQPITYIGGTGIAGAWLHTEPPPLYVAIHEAQPLEEPPMTSQDVPVPDGAPTPKAPDFSSLGRLGYETYSAKMDGISAVDGRKLLTWDHMSDQARQAWAHAACAIVLENTPGRFVRGAPVGAAAPRPYLNAQVHYVSYGTPKGEFPSVCRSALVTELDPTSSMLVGLFVANPDGQFFRSLVAGGCLYNAGGVPDRTRPNVRAYPGGTWHWSADCHQ